MRRLATVLACVLSLPVLAFAQAQAPATPAKYVRPVKGMATIDVVQPPSKRVGGDMVTVIKVKNTSTGAINLLRIDEYWYDAKGAMVTAGQYAHKKAPILPGEIAEITVKSPYKPGAQQNQMQFRHANGDVKATKVKAFK
jgi:uncharacterized protein YcfL